MTTPSRGQNKDVDKILRDRARRLAERVLADERHLQEIRREVNALKKIVRKNAKRHR